MTPGELTQRRGAAAHRVLGDPDVMQAFGEIEADLVTQWAATNPNRSEDREAIYRQVKALELFQAQLETWRNNMLLYDQNVLQRKRDQQGLQAEA